MTMNEQYLAWKLGAYYDKDDPEKSAFRFAMREAEKRIASRARRAYKAGWDDAEKAVRGVRGIIVDTDMDPVVLDNLTRVVLNRVLLEMKINRPLFKEWGDGRD